MIKKYQSKVIKAEALLIDASNADEIAEFVGHKPLIAYAKKDGIKTAPDGYYIACNCDAYLYHAQYGDFVVKNERNVIRIFSEKDLKDYYEEAADESKQPQCDSAKCSYKLESKLSFGFGAAISALQRGEYVTRKGWNGRGMFLWLNRATVIDEALCHDETKKAIAKNLGGGVLALGTICMFTHDSTGRSAILTGWLASQSDMLSDDWVILDPHEVNLPRPHWALQEEFISCQG